MLNHEWYRNLGPKKCKFCSGQFDILCSYYILSGEEPPHGKRCTIINCPLRLRNLEDLQNNIIDTSWHCQTYTEAGIVYKDVYIERLSLAELVDKILLASEHTDIVKIEIERRA